MGMPQITGGAYGIIADYRHNWRNQDALARGCAIMCRKIGGTTDYDVVLYGNAAAGKVIGPLLTEAPAPELTTYVPVDAAGVLGVAIAQAPARCNLILAANNAVAAGDFLIPTGTAGAVIPRPAGSSATPIAQAVVAQSSTASEVYLYCELLPLPADIGQVVCCEGRDAATTAYFLGGPGSAHINPAATKNTPVVFQAIAPCTLDNFRASLDVAPGATMGVTFEIHVGATAALSNAAAASSPVLAIVNAGLTASDDTHPISLTAGQCVTVKAVATGAGIGTTEGSRVQFRVR